MPRSPLKLLSTAGVLSLLCTSAHAFDLTANHGGLAVEWVQSTQGRAMDFAAGDADDDGDIDLFVVDELTLQLWMNDGTGRFTVRPDPVCAFAVRAVLFVDVDADSRLDLVVAPQRVDGGIAVRRGLGAGQFADPEFTATGRAYAELVDAGMDTHGVRMLLARPEEPEVGIDVFAREAHGLRIVSRQLSDVLVTGVASADVNRDGFRDIIAGVVREEYYFGEICVLLGSSTGFALSAQIQHHAVTRIVTLDVDHDGNRDLVVASDFAADVLLGDGTGYQWREAARLCQSSESPGLFATDMNQDGNLELFLSRRDGPEGVFLNEYRGPADFLGLASREFSYMHAQELGMPASSMLSADLDGDGELDLALCTESMRSSNSGGPGMISVILRRPDGELAGIRLHPLAGPRSFFGLTSARFRRTGPPDLLLRSREGLFVTSLKDGELTSATRIGEGSLSYWNANSVRCTDLNRDGLDDLILATSGDSSEVRLTSPDGSPGPVAVQIAGTVVDDADMDHDGFRDLLVSHGSASFAVVWGSPTHRFDRSNPIPLRAQDEYRRNLAVFADVDGDGRKEVVLLCASFWSDHEPEQPDEITVYSVSDSRSVRALETTQPEWILTYSATASQVAAVDLDGLPGDELVVLIDPSGWNGSELVVLRSVGASSYGVDHRCRIGGEGPVDLAFADLDSDGDLDAVCSANFEAYMGMVHVRWNDGRGNLTGGWARRMANGQANGVATADFDGDGVRDVAIATPVWDGSASRIAFLFGRHYRAGTVSKASLTRGPNWVPDPTLVIHGISPNPARGSFAIDWTARPGVPIDIEMHDVTGRRVSSERLATPGTTQRATRFEPPKDLPAGLYWIRLRQGELTATKRVVLVR